MAKVRISTPPPHGAQGSFREKTVGEASGVTENPPSRRRGCG
ncbi:hypothetical protein TNCT_214911, partial [Trichonephila clavata]